jgi:hypothetical protein
VADPEVEHLTAQWHEARAADLLRPRERPNQPGDTGTVRSAPDVALALAHIELAKSLRLAEIGKALLEGGRANANGLRRIAERSGR